MATELRNTINELAASFAASVLEALRAMSLEEILAATGRAPALARGAAGRGGGAARTRGGGGAAAPARPVVGRLERRSADDIAGMVDRIVALLEKHPQGLRAERIREELAVHPKELPRPIAEALAKRRIRKEGQKRATTYFVTGSAAKSAKGAASEASSAAKKGGARSGRRASVKGAGAKSASAKKAKETAK